MKALTTQFRTTGFAQLCAAMALATVLALSACGGGSAALETLAGVGTGGSGLAEGTVSGFGSVFIDGVEYDDSNASVAQDDGAGESVNAELKLGQRVRLVLDSSSKVQSVMVMPQLVGPVTQAMDAAGTFKVMGQGVRLGDNAAQVGFGASKPGLGDELEVHGSWVYDKATASYVLSASRVEKLTSAPDPVQLSGLVQSIAGSTLRLNSADGISLQTESMPAGLAVGRLVRVWASRAALTAAAGKTLLASRLVDATLSATELAEQTLRLGGQAAQYNAAARTLEIQGVKVQLPAGLQVDEAALSKGDFVALEVKRTGGVLVATALNLRGGAGGAADLGQSVSLKAVSSGVDWKATPVRFKLRGVDVMASQLVVDATCRQAGTEVDLLIEVKGRLATATDTVVATELRCTPLGNNTNGNGSTVSRSGSVSQLNLKARNFVLQTARDPITVQWDAQTYLPIEFTKHPESLTGQSVEVEGVYQTGVLRARKIKRSH